MSDRDSNSVLLISHEMRDDLAHLAKHADKLPQIARMVGSSRPGIELANVVGTSVGLSSDEAQRILWTIWNLHRLRKGLRMESARLIDEVTISLESQTDDAWKAEYLGPWKNTHDETISLLDTITDEHPLAINSKAAGLGRAHQNLLIEASIITDVRPVFNTVGDKVVESLIIHTLLIDYYNGAQRRRAELALDANDIAHIRRQCDRADGKAAVLKTSLKDMPWGIAVLGEEGLQ